MTFYGVIKDVLLYITERKAKAESQWGKRETCTASINFGLALRSAVSPGSLESLSALHTMPTKSRMADPN